ncbi:unnamed protein product [Calypogeia fissa]
MFSPFGEFRKAILSVWTLEASTSPTSVNVGDLVGHQASTSKASVNVRVSVSPWTGKRVILTGEIEASPLS